MKPIGSGIMWGCPDNKPKLPVGWEYWEHPGSFLFAKSPDGKPWYGQLWYVSQDKLYLCRFATRWDVIRTWIRTCGRHAFRLGQPYADMRYTFNLESHFSIGGFHQEPQTGPTTL